jgi:hypothetical protein
MITARRQTTRMSPPGHKHSAAVRPLTGEAGPGAPLVSGLMAAIW